MANAPRHSFSHVQSSMLLPLAALATQIKGPAGGQQSTFLTHKHSQLFPFFPVGTSTGCHSTDSTHAPCSGHCKKQLQPLKKKKKSYYMQHFSLSSILSELLNADINKTWRKRSSKSSHTRTLPTATCEAASGKRDI